MTEEGGSANRADVECNSPGESLSGESKDKFGFHLELRVSVLYGNNLAKLLLAFILSLN
jgi:hypothetical protein